MRVAALSGDNSLAVFQVAGADVVSGGTVTLPAGSTSVDVVASATDAAASVSVVGRSGLVTGSNTVTVTVTAANGSVRTYTVTVVVLALSSNTDLSVFTVNGSVVVDGDRVVLAKGSVSASVVATAADSAATVSMVGRSNLVEGNNTLTVTVTAANGTTRTYTVTLYVTPRSTDASLSVFTVNGGAVAPLIVKTLRFLLPLKAATFTVTV